MQEIETLIVSGENWAAEAQGCPSNFGQNECIAYPGRNTQSGDVKKVKAPYSYVTISTNAGVGVAHVCMEQKGKGGSKDFSLNTPVHCVRPLTLHLLPLQQLFVNIIGKRQKMIWGSFLVKLYRNQC